MACVLMQLVVVALTSALINAQVRYGGGGNQVVQTTYQQPQPTYQQPQQQQQCAPQYVTQTQYVTNTQVQTVPQYITSTRTVPQYITSTVAQYNTNTKNVPSYVTQTVTLPCKIQQQRPTGYGSNNNGAALNFVAGASGGNVQTGYGK
ncbi:unnamed protein product [Meganyctiphanes norvegica]|uniref:Uncharacterized protein n=1 Tax=Meganyctiphanes norvegica TaxID=48144 RepID=A0AAV2PUW8_MEGNR